jgi:hypothetical protein
MSEKLKGTPIPEVCKELNKITSTRSCSGCDQPMKFLGIMSKHSVFKCNDCDIVDEVLIK